MPTKKQISDCCQKEVKTVCGEDFSKDDEIGTCHYECSGCGKPCNVYVKSERQQVIDEVVKEIEELPYYLLNSSLPGILANSEVIIRKNLITKLKNLTK